MKESEENNDSNKNNNENQRKNKKFSLHELVSQYFDCENHEDFLNYVQSHLPEHQHIRSQPVSEKQFVSLRFYVCGARACVFCVVLVVCF